VVRSLLPLPVALKASPAARQLSLSLPLLPMQPRDCDRAAFWICGPDEGLWGGVGLGKEAIDSDLEIDEGAEDAALEGCELGEDAFHGVEPRRDWGEVERPAGMSRKPAARYSGANAACGVAALPSRVRDRRRRWDCHFLPSAQARPGRDGASRVSRSD
jgi:hypothetical protein